mmetsp:Transcript_4235/g.10796  ORF Transcript_4235/g.10796 Transcript_4235/m.10796 type:complete len:336 (-) Transcript_4235:565-1572(-)
MLAPAASAGSSREAEQGSHRPTVTSAARRYSPSGKAKACEVLICSQIAPGKMHGITAGCSPVGPPPTNSTCVTFARVPRHNTPASSAQRLCVGAAPCETGRSATVTLMESSSAGNPSTSSSSARKLPSADSSPTMSTERPSASPAARRVSSRCTASTPVRLKSALAVALSCASAPASTCSACTSHSSAREPVSASSLQAPSLSACAPRSNGTPVFSSERAAVRDTCPRGAPPSPTRTRSVLAWEVRHSFSQPPPSVPLSEEAFAACEEQADAHRRRRSPPPPPLSPLTPSPSLPPPTLPSPSPPPPPPPPSRANSLTSAQSNSGSAPPMHSRKRS